jgi:hypothetical protein
MVAGDRIGDVLQQHGLAGPRRRHDEAPLTLPQGGDEINDPGRQILLARIDHLHLEALLRVERGQVIEMHLVARLLRLFEIDRVDLQKSKVALALLRTSDFAFDRIPGPQSKSPDLARTYIDIIWSRQVVSIGRS